MDRLRVVTFSSGGRPITRLDLNDDVNYALERDTLKFDAPERQQQWSESLQRYGGAELTQESHKNGQLSASWYISGGGVADTALQRMETLMVELESLDQGRYIEWRPDGATHSTYFPIKGPSAWEFLYRWIEFQAVKTLHLKAGWTIAPLGEGERMTIGDPFDVNSLTDYSALTGSGMAYTAGTGLTTTSTATQLLKHTGRGYNYGDVQVAVSFTTGSTLGAAQVSALLGVIDANNWVGATADISAAQLTIWINNSGTITNVGNIALGTIAINTNYWIVARREGNLITSELWTTPPVVTTAPRSSTTTTLTGANATKYGIGSSGGVGVRTVWPSPTGWSIKAFNVDPFTYDVSNPARIDASGSIPGDATAKGSMSVGQTGLATPFALLGWTKTPGGGTAAPFGVFEAETATLTTWAATADATYRNGNGAKVTTSGAGTAAAVWSFNPSYMTPDDFGCGDIDVEIWARVQLASGVVSPVITASVAPTAGTSFGPRRYTQEWGSSGKLLTRPSSGTPLRLTRLGVVTLSTLESISWDLRFDASWGSASVGVFGLDYIILVPAQTRAAYPTGKINDSTYPKFVASTSATQRYVNFDLSTRTAVPGSAAYPDASMAGSTLEFKPGNFSFVFKTSEYAPDDPSSTSSGESVIGASNRVQFTFIPRYFLPRG